MKKIHELCMKAKLESGEIDANTAAASIEEEDDVVEGGDSD